MTDAYSPSAASPTAALHEEAVELAALSWLELTGWRTVAGDYLAPMGQWARGGTIARRFSNRNCARRWRH